MFILAANVLAQHSSDSGKAHAEGEPPFEVSGGYSYLREEGHNLNGWTGTFIGNINH